MPAIHTRPFAIIRGMQPLERRVPGCFLRIGVVIETQQGIDGLELGNIVSFVNATVFR